MIPDDGGRLTRQAQAAIEAFMASGPGEPGRVTLRLLTAGDQRWAITSDMTGLSPRTRIRACRNAEPAGHAPISARTSPTVRSASVTNPGFVSG